MNRFAELIGKMGWAVVAARLHFAHRTPSTRLTRIYLTHLGLKSSERPAMRMPRNMFGSAGYAALMWLLAMNALYVQNANANPAISWSQKEISVSVEPGIPQTLEVTLTAQSNIEPSKLQIVPSLAPYLQIFPQSTPALKKGESVAFTVAFDTPADALPATVQGTIQLRSTGEARPSAGKTIANPLPVTVNISWSTFGLGEEFQFSYPAFGLPSQVSVLPLEDATFYEVLLETSDEVFVPQFSIAVIQNPSLMPLLDWFTANVDPNSTMMTSGVFAVLPFDNGAEAIIRKGEIPDQIANEFGPPGEAYAISPSRRSILVVRFSHISELDTFGVAQPATQDFLAAILYSAVAP